MYIVILSGMTSVARNVIERSPVRSLFAWGILRHDKGGGYFIAAALVGSE